MTHWGSPLGVSAMDGNTCRVLWELNEIMHMELLVHVMYYLHSSQYCVPLTFLVKKGSSEAITGILILPHLTDSTQNDQ